MIDELIIIHSLLDKITHKDIYKATTTRRFKDNLITLLMKKSFEGDLLEVGSNTGETTLILAKVAKILNKKVYAYENDQNRITLAKKLMKKHDVDNVEFVKKNVYVDKWNITNIGFVFIDCIHKKEFFKRDIINTKKILNEEGIIVAHDYGLITLNGDGIKSHIENNDDLEIVSFLGEEKNWNQLGSGKVVDWEAVELKFK